MNVGWSLSYRQRRLHCGDSYLPDVATCITLPVSAKGTSFCVLDEFTELLAEEGDAFQAQISIINVSLGSLLYCYCSEKEIGMSDHGDVTLSAKGTVCLLHRLGLVLLNVNSPVTPDACQRLAWSQHGLGHAQLPSPGNTSDSETSNNAATWREDSGEQTCILWLSLSACCSIDAVLKREGGTEGDNGCLGPLCHRHLAETGADEQEMQPAVCSGKLPFAIDLASLAWYPRRQAVVYAVYDVGGTVHLIDAKADCLVRSWQCAELLAQNLADDEPLPAGCDIPGKTPRGHSPPPPANRRTCSTQEHVPGASPGKTQPGTGEAPPNFKTLLHPGCQTF